MVTAQPGSSFEQDRPLTATTTTYVASADEPDVATRKDRVRWGPILAGLLTTIVTLVVLTVLGLAIGMSAFDPGDDGAGTAAVVWGVISALIAFFAGGYVAARSAAVDGEGAGALNGFLVGVAAIVLILWLLGSGLGNLLGTVGSNISEIADLGQTVNVLDGQDAATIAQENYDEARNSAWGTLIGLLLALGAASLGGWAGHNHHAELIRGGGRAVGTTRSGGRAVGTPRTRATG